MRVPYKPSSKEHHHRAMKHAQHHGRISGSGLCGHAFHSMLKKAESHVAPALMAAGTAGLQSIMNSKSGSLGDKLEAAAASAGSAGVKKLAGKGIRKKPARKRPF